MDKTNSEITFSFGKNWKEYLSTVTVETIELMEQSLEGWLGRSGIRDKSIIDIGCGSGLSSLCFWRLGCAKLVSFDYDIHSVNATRELAKKIDSPENWNIFQGSILDAELCSNIGTFDIVHSWGVLHHTGDLWKALSNAFDLVKANGIVMISIYTAGDQYFNDLSLKQNFNEGDSNIKSKMVKREAKRMVRAGYANNIDELKSARRERGMSIYYDIIDWLGGLPYEVAWPSEVLSFSVKKQLDPVRMFERSQGGCTEYLFKKSTSETFSVTNTFKWSSNNKPEIVNRTLFEQIRNDFSTAMSQFEVLNKKMSSSKVLLRTLRRILLLKIFNRFSW